MKRSHSFSCKDSSLVPVSGTGAIAEPHFLTIKYSVQRLVNSLNIYNEQLKFHFRNTDNLYRFMCNCSKHMHNRKPCSVTNEKVCPKCDKPSQLMLDYRVLLFHGNELLTKNAYRCCKHIHYPPCNRCLNCNTYIDGVRQPCLVLEPFECDLISEAVCVHHEPKRLTSRLPVYNFADHVYNIKLPLFYLCPVHVHKHRMFWGQVVDCNIQTYQCCQEAVSLKQYDYSFVITVANAASSGQEIVKSRKLQLKKTEYIIYDPRIWREQSLNHFVSFIRSVILGQSNIKDRYARLTSSSFIINNLHRYMSGKDSVSRLLITGFETTGIYQTATISCELPDDIILVPQRLYNLMREKFYFPDRICIKRDPSIQSTCMSVKYCLPHPDPSQNTIVVNDAIVKPMNQDQDGDKNAIYALTTRDSNNDDTTQSYLHRVARMEMTLAMKKVVTIIANPRLSISESGRLLLTRFPERFMDLEFARRTLKHGHK